MMRLILIHKISLVGARIYLFDQPQKRTKKNIAHYNIYETIWMKLIQHDDDLCTEFGDLLDDERR